MKKKAKADADKAQAAAVEKAKADQQAADARAVNCASAQQQARNLSLGGRVARVNANGEREYLDDAAIAADLKRRRRPPPRRTAARPTLECSNRPGVPNGHARLVHESRVFCAFTARSRNALTPPAAR